MAAGCVADERGSVVAVTNAGGDAIDINAYDEFGIPSQTTPANAGRFGYTGQAWLPSLGMWYYKARMYSPTLGRFLQTDPIGYGDGANWYNYTHGDPVNGSDPTGLFCADSTDGGSAADCAEHGGYVANTPYTQEPGRDVTVNGKSCTAANNCRSIEVGDYARSVVVMVGGLQPFDATGGDIIVVGEPQKPKPFTCAVAMNEPGKIRAIGYTVSVTGLFGVTATWGTWRNLTTGTTGSFEESRFTVGLGVGGTKTTVTYDNMATFTGNSDGLSVSGTVMQMGPVGAGGAYAWSWNESGSGQGGGGGLAPSFAPRFSLEGSSTYTNISNCVPGQK